MDDRDRLLTFYSECLAANAPVAPAALINDSQTKRIFELLGASVAGVRIIDYGCGRLRLLNALLTRHPADQWYYRGVDIENPSVVHPDEVSALRGRHIGKRAEFSTIAELRAGNDKFDVAVLMNVLHELPVDAMSTVFEDLRRCLTASGRLIVVDTVFLPTGEPDFVPFYPWEIEKLCPTSKSYSYTSGSGIPILVYDIPAKSIPRYHHLVELVPAMFARKRDAWALLAQTVRKSGNPEELKALGLGELPVFDYGYLNTIAVNAHARLLEESSDLPDVANINDCARRLLQLFRREWLSTGRIVSANNAYDLLVPEFNYAAIWIVLGAVSSGVPNLIFPITELDEPLRPTDMWDFADDHDHFAILDSDGLFEFLIEVRRDYAEHYR